MNVIAVARDVRDGYNKGMKRSVAQRWGNGEFNESV